LGWNLELLTSIEEEGMTRDVDVVLGFGFARREEGGRWSKGFEINYLITMID
jgi:hypothetical protein